MPVTHRLGAVISQRGKPIAFYSRKLNDAQTRYTTTERELLAIVETLKEFRNILLGQEIIVYTDHKNLTYKNFNTERVMRWRLVLKEYGPKLEYIKGESNVVADALSRLEMEETEAQKQHLGMSEMAEVFGMTKEDLTPDVFPLSYKNILIAQQKDKDLLRKTQKYKEYSIKTFRGGGKSRSLICLQGKIVIPKPLQKQLVEWYHQQLCHPGETRTEATIRQHYTWNGLRETVQAVCSKCHTCQITKRSHKKYGHLPEKEAECRPWEKLCVDLIGPYTMDRKGKSRPLILWCVTMIDPATGWFEMREITDKQAITVANIVEQAWLTRYPWPTELTYDKGTEFMAEFAQMIVKDYGIKKKGNNCKKPTSKCHTQKNSPDNRQHDKNIRGTRQLLR